MWIYGLFQGSSSNWLLKWSPSAVPRLYADPFDTLISNLIWYTSARALSCSVIQHSQNSTYNHLKERLALFIWAEIFLLIIHVRAKLEIKQRAYFLRRKAELTRDVHGTLIRLLSSIVDVYFISYSGTVPPVVNDNCEFNCKGRASRDNPRREVEEVLNEFKRDCPRL